MRPPFGGNTIDQANNVSDFYIQILYSTLNWAILFAHINVFKRPAQRRKLRQTGLIIPFD